VTTMTRTRSRLSESPTAIIDAEAAALASQAEVVLLRRLLLRCDICLADMVQEARIDGEPDFCAEELRRDIAVALDSNLA